MDNNYHEKDNRRSHRRRRDDNHKDTLLKACELSLRLKEVDRIKDILRYAIESTEGK